MEKSASQEIDSIIELYGGWKGNLLAQLRSIITSAGPTITEETKWKMKTRPEGLPVWMHGGIVCYAETYKENIKLIFNDGAKLKDEHSLFNARLESSKLRAIEFHEGDKVDEVALKDLVIEAVQFLEAKGK